GSRCHHFPCFECRLFTSWLGMIRKSDVHVRRTGTFHFHGNFRRSAAPNQGWDPVRGFRVRSARMNRPPGQYCSCSEHRKANANRQFLKHYLESPSKRMGAVYCVQFSETVWQDVLVCPERYWHGRKTEKAQPDSGCAPVS